MRELYIITLLSILLACGFTDDLGSASVHAEQVLDSNISKTCGQKGAWLQVLGSGGPELSDKRASSSYLIWVNGQARILIDAGAGSALHFEKTGANFSDLDFILLSHLHVDHTADLSAYLKGSFFSERADDLKVLGPSGNSRMPSTQAFIERLFKTDEGAYQYLGDYLPDDETQSKAGYQFSGEVYTEPKLGHKSKIKVQAVPVKHGPIPALAWRLDLEGKAIVLSGDMSSGSEDFIKLLDSSDIFLAHNAIPSKAGRAAKNLHMTPPQIGEYAALGKVKKIVLSHRMTRTLGDEANTLKEISQAYKGPVVFSDDLDCFKL